eukprot:TRINITY_DN11291_c0_g1_i1.p1 TRINITY_DN11291_c0_g1~~TRINITY_DN11291_c0_g1_i1.p1  ORF type:complete len:2953 (+),score=642.70 TRINITY_DN11291_c0_g1_i1:144-9002(+)
MADDQTDKAALLACIDEEALKDITSPVHLNGGALQDVYKLHTDDFDDPETLEVSYDDGKGGIVNEVVFVDPIFADRRPRICVSIDGIQAMHATISTLTRKVDNLVLSLSQCRTNYYKEITNLKSQLNQQALASAQGRDFKIRDTTLFDPSHFGDGSVKEEIDKQVKLRTKVLHEQLSQAMVENARVRKRIEMIESQSSREILEAQTRSHRFDVREYCQELVSHVNMDVLIKTLSKCAQDEGEFYETVENAITEHRGLTTKISDMVKQQKQDELKMNNLHVELSKAKADYTQALRDLEATTQAVVETTTRWKSTDSQVQFMNSTIQDLETIITDHKKQISELEKEPDELKAEIIELQAQHEQELVSLNAALQEAQEKAKELMQQDDASKSTRMPQSAPDVVKVVAQTFSPHEQGDIVVGMTRKLNGHMHHKIAAEYLKALAPDIRAEYLQQIIEFGGQSIGTFKARLDTVEKVAHSFSQDDMPFLVDHLPNSLKSQVTIKVLEELASAEDGDGDLQQPDDTYLDLATALSKNSRKSLMSRLMKHLQPSEAKHLIDELGKKQKKAMVLALFEDQEESDLKLCAEQIFLEQSIKAFVSGLGAKANEEFLLSCAKRMTMDQAIKIIETASTLAAADKAGADDAIEVAKHNEMVQTDLSSVEHELIVNKRKHEEVLDSSVVHKALLREASVQTDTWQPPTVVAASAESPEVAEVEAPAAATQAEPQEEPMPVEAAPKVEEDEKPKAQEEVSGFFLTSVTSAHEEELAALRKETEQLKKDVERLRQENVKVADKLIHSQVELEELAAQKVRAEKHGQACEKGLSDAQDKLGESLIQIESLKDALLEANLESNSKAVAKMKVSTKTQTAIGSQQVSTGAQTAMGTLTEVRKGVARSRFELDTPAEYPTELRARVKMDFAYLAMQYLTRLRLGVAQDEGNLEALPDIHGHDTIRDYIDGVVDFLGAAKLLRVFGYSQPTEQTALVDVQHSLDQLKTLDGSIREMAENGQHQLDRITDQIEKAKHEAAKGKQEHLGSQASLATSATNRPEASPEMTPSSSTTSLGPGVMPSGSLSSLHAAASTQSLLGTVLPESGEAILEEEDEDAMPDLALQPSSAMAKPRVSTVVMDFTGLGHVKKETGQSKLQSKLRSLTGGGSVASALKSRMAAKGSEARTSSHRPSIAAAGSEMRTSSRRPSRAPSPSPPASSPPAGEQAASGGDHSAGAMLWLKTALGKPKDPATWPSLRDDAHRKAHMTLAEQELESAIQDAATAAAEEALEKRLSATEAAREVAKTTWEEAVSLGSISMSLENVRAQAGIATVALLKVLFPVPKEALPEDVAEVAAEVADKVAAFSGFDDEDVAVEAAFSAAAAAKDTALSRGESAEAAFAEAAIAAGTAAYTRAMAKAGASAEDQSVQLEQQYTSRQAETAARAAEVAANAEGLPPAEAAIKASAAAGAAAASEAISKGAAPKRAVIFATAQAANAAIARGLPTSEVKKQAALAAGSAAALSHGESKPEVVAETAAAAAKFVALEQGMSMEDAAKQASEAAGIAAAEAAFASGMSSAETVQAAALQTAVHAKSGGISTEKRTKLLVKSAATTAASKRFSGVSGLDVQTAAANAAKAVEVVASQQGMSPELAVRQAVSAAGMAAAELALDTGMTASDAAEAAASEASAAASARGMVAEEALRQAFLAAGVAGAQAAGTTHPDSSQQAAGIAAAVAEEIVLSSGGTAEEAVMKAAETAGFAAAQNASARGLQSSKTVMLAAKEAANFAISRGVAPDAVAKVAEAAAKLQVEFDSIPEDEAAVQIVTSRGNARARASVAAGMGLDEAMLSAAEEVKKTVNDGDADEILRTADNVLTGAAVAEFISKSSRPPTAHEAAETATMVTGKMAPAQSVMQAEAQQAVEKANLAAPTISVSAAAVAGGHSGEQASEKTNVDAQAPSANAAIAEGRSDLEASETANVAARAVSGTAAVARGRPAQQSFEKQNSPIERSGERASEKATVAAPSATPTIAGGHYGKDASETSNVAALAISGHSATAGGHSGTANVAAQAPPSLFYAPSLPPPPPSGTAALVVGRPARHAYEKANVAAQPLSEIAAIARGLSGEQASEKVTVAAQAPSATAATAGGRPALQEYETANVAAQAPSRTGAIASGRPARQAYEKANVAAQPPSELAAISQGLSGELPSEQANVAVQAPSRTGAIASGRPARQAYEKANVAAQPPSELAAIAQGLSGELASEQANVAAQAPSRTGAIASGRPARQAYDKANVAAQPPSELVAIAQGLSGELASEQANVAAQATSRTGAIASGRPARQAYEKANVAAQPPSELAAIAQGLSAGQASEKVTVAAQAPFATAAIAGGVAGEVAGGPGRSGEEPSEKVNVVAQATTAAIARGRSPPELTLAAQAVPSARGRSAGEVSARSRSTQSTPVMDEVKPLKMVSLGMSAVESKQRQKGSKQQPALARSRRASAARVNLREDAQQPSPPQVQLSSRRDSAGSTRQLVPSDEPELASPTGLPGVKGALPRRGSRDDTGRLFAGGYPPPESRGGAVEPPPAVSGAAADEEVGHDMQSLQRLQQQLWKAQQEAARLEFLQVQVEAAKQNLERKQQISRGGADPSLRTAPPGKKESKHKTIGNLTSAPLLNKVPFVYSNTSRGEQAEEIAAVKEALRVSASASYEARARLAQPEEAKAALPPKRQLVDKEPPKTNMELGFDGQSFSMQSPGKNQRVLEARLPVLEDNTQAVKAAQLAQHSLAANEQERARMESLGLERNDYEFRTRHRTPRIQGQEQSGTYTLPHQGDWVSRQAAIGDSSIYLDGIQGISNLDAKAVFQPRGRDQIAQRGVHVLPPASDGLRAPEKPSASQRGRHENAAAPTRAPARRYSSSPSRSPGRSSSHNPSSQSNLTKSQKHQTDSNAKTPRIPSKAKPQVRLASPRDFRKLPTLAGHGFPSLSGLTE